MLKQIKCLISGRVQGVLYRDFARRKAIGLGLTGEVRNLPDGAVSIIAQGGEAELNLYIKELERGSIFSRVDEVKVNWSEAENKFSDFKIFYENFTDRF